MKSGNEWKILLMSLLYGSISTGFAEFFDDGSLQNFEKSPPPHHIHGNLSTNNFARIEKSLSCDARRGDASVSFPTYRVERQAFQGSDVRQITIPEGVTFIDRMAFSDCPNLNEVSFPSTLQDIENSFVNCANLSDVDLSSAFQLQCLVGSFQGCASLTTVTLPQNLKEIGNGTFEGCANLTSFPEVPSVKFIGDSAFKGTGLTRTPLLDHVEYIAQGAFDTGKPILWDFGDVTWVDDPGQSGEDLLLSYPEAMGIRSKNRLSLNPIVLSLTEKTFVQFPWKKEIQILSIPQEFQSLESLKGLVNLQDLEIPDGYRLSSVSDFIFDECPNLMMPAFIPSIETDGIFHTIPTEDKSIQSALVLYGAQVLSPGTFQNCKNLTKVRLADSLQGVGEKAFFGCVGLTSLTLPDSLEMIGNEAFSGCTKLSKLYGTHQISQLNENVFENCPELGVIQIFSYDDQKVMAGPLKDNLQTAFVLQGAESIGERAFYYCSSLSSIILPDSLRSIGYYAFQHCSSLSSIILPDSVQTIRSFAFSDCYSLASIVLPDSLQSIGKSAFERCSELIEIDVSKITLEVTNSISWTDVFYNSTDRTHVTKVICRQEQADKMESVFTNATLTYVD